jgi:hypothetical protein
VRTICPSEIEPRIDAASVTAQPPTFLTPTSLSIVSTMKTMDTMAIYGGMSGRLRKNWLLAGSRARASGWRRP